MKKKILKTCFVGCLATCLTLTGIFAFAPMTANAKVINTNQEKITESTGLISPKEDDPVLFTTEFGLEIKYGNSTTMLGGGNEVVDDSIVEGTLSSGNLSGFPYFTTNDGSNDYTWVIIGKSSSFETITEYQTLNYWQSCVNGDPVFYSNTLAKFFEEQYEVITPCGEILESTINEDLIARKLEFSISASLNNINATDEIPHGCVLVLANDAISSGVYNTRSGYDHNGYDFFGMRWNASNIRVTLQTAYTEGYWGLSEIKTTIKTCTLKSSSTYWNGKTWEPPVQSDNDSLFVLAGSSNGTYLWSSYLTATQIKLSTNQWLRDGGDYASGQARPYYGGKVLNASGVLTSVSVNTSAGYRPAFVMSLT